MIAAALVLMAASPPTPEPSLVEDPDLRCVAAIAAVLGMAKDDKAADVQLLAGLTGIFMYYVGKVDARRPGFDYGRGLRQLVDSPGYEQRLPEDMKRCGDEAQERGAMLQDLGRAMKAAAPIGQSRSG